MAKLPAPDLARIETAAPDYRQVEEVLWRLHEPAHPDHPLRWNRLRSHGPLATARFDPWMPPADDHAPEGVGYFGLDIPTCLAEVFQDTRHVDVRRGGLQLSAFTSTRPLSLLDLRGGWPLKIGASHLLNSGPRNRCREWAHALRKVHPGADGLLFTGMAGLDCIAAYTPPGDFFPATPGFSRPLSDPGLESRVADAAEQIGYSLSWGAA